jgi:excinuclease UvrABC ATPase subunit
MAYQVIEILTNYSNGKKKALVEIECSRCSGHGRLPSYQNVNHGICFKCNGLGVEKKEVVIQSNEKFKIIKETTEVKPMFNTTKHENEMVRNALKSHYEERKQSMKDAHEAYKRELEEARQHEEDMKNNPDDYRFSWDD